MAKKTKQDAQVFDIINGNFDEHDGFDIEVSLQQKLRDLDSGKVNGITVNGATAEKDLNGNINITIPSVDRSLSTESTNPVGNDVITQEVNSLKGKSIGNIYTEDAGDGENVNLVIENESGMEIASCQIPKSGGDSNQSHVKVTTSLSKTRIKSGEGVVLTWKYENLDGEGETTGRVAETVTIRVVNGNMETFSTTLYNINAGRTDTLTLGPDILPAGSIGVYVIAVARLDDGTEQRGQSYKSVSVVTMNLTSSFDPSSQLALNNGYPAGSTVDVPFVFTGPKGTAVTMWLDGVQFDSKTISTSTASTGHFYVNANNIAAGRHNVQLVAESDGLLSNALYFDFLKAGISTPYVGLKLTFPVDDLSNMPIGYANGVETSSVPVAVVQYDELSFNFAAWNADSVTSAVTVALDGVTRQNISADRSLQMFSDRFETSGVFALTLSVGNTTRTLSLDVEAASGVDVEEVSDYYLKLSAAGRSNSESVDARSNWGGVTTFEGVDWKTNGWDTKEGCAVLKLTNGAKAVIGYKPFALSNEYSVGNHGMTIEVELMVSDVLLRGAQIMQCLSPKLNGDSDLGIGVTTEKAGIFLGEVQHVPTAETDEHGDTIVIDRVLGVENYIAPDRWIKLAFVMESNAGGRKMMLYINGVLSKANRYDVGTNLIQQVAQDITFDSTSANLYIRSIRIYRRALTETEVLSNYIVDRPTFVEVRTKYDDNNVLTEQGTLDMNTLINRGRGVLVIIRSEDTGTGLEDVFALNDKKQDFEADYIHWYSPLGRANDFEAYNVYIRIQGTSSTKYPWKNIRIYLNKGPKTAEKPLRLLIGGVETSSLKYPLRGDNSIAQSVLCAKTDFVDSSMVLNTGGARLFHDTMLTLGLLTPPQEYDRRVRQAIDGIPCDMFCGTSINGTLTYYGSFNLDNEKSKSGAIFGMEGVKDSEGVTVPWYCPIALEALDNGSPMTLFQIRGSNGSSTLETQLEQEFDDGFEFNYPEDTFWSSTKVTDPTKESVASATRKAAIRILMGWIHDCFMNTAGVLNGTMSLANPDYGTSAGWNTTSRAKWVSTKFKNEAGAHFDINHLLTYYLFTDYWASVDQRAKNILWRTWDGVKWYSTFYDGDTAMSIRNDAFMVYLYNVTRDTWDDERRKYAFEGHDSFLWCLVLANFETELRQCATTLRGVLTTPRMLKMFNEEMQGNWCERQYNMSQILKYINTMDVQNYVYTLTGNREAHRTAFLTDRSQLLDAKYATSSFQSDNVNVYVARTASNTPSVMRIKSGDLYYYGYGTNNNPLIYGPIEALAGDVVALTFSMTMQASDPARVYGASRMKEIDFSQMLGQLTGSLDLSKCKMLAKIVMPLSNNTPNLGVQLIFGSISMVEYIDLTGQTSTGTNNAGTVLDVSGQGRLETLLAGGTALTNVVLPEGAPISTLVLPSTLTRLSLRYLPSLSPGGLTLQSTQNVTHFSFAECPNLDWKSLLEQCPNVQYIRIEGVYGIVSPEFLETYMDLGGIDANNIETTYPVMTGKVMLTSVVSAERLANLREKFSPGGLDIDNAQYSEYVFDDKEIDPCNITNEDNKTGYKYRDSSATPSSHSSVTGHPFNYTRSGHIVLLHDKCVPVTGYINPTTNKMHIEALDKTNYGKLKDGVTDSDITGGSTVFVRDVFLYVPKYYYKGVNNYKEGTKHFFLSSHTTQPNSTATKTTVLQLSTLDSYVGVPFKERCSVGSAFDVNQLGTLSGQSIHTYRVSVDGYRQVRFPSMLDNDEFTVGVFVNDEGVIVDRFTLTMQGSTSNPADFDNDLGDYDFRDVPAGAKYLYFYCKDTAAATSPVVVLTDSMEIEAIEPDWVEHKSELVGIFQGWVDGMPTTSGGVPNSYLRSIKGRTITRSTGYATSGSAATNSGWQYNTETGDAIGSLPATTTNGTNQDFFNLAAIRNSIQQVDKGDNKYGYSLVSYETSKDLANLLMVWFGTRDVESFVGRGANTNSYTTGAISNSYTDTNRIATNAHNVMWGLECWTATYNEWIEKICINAPSYLEFKKNKHLNKSGWVADGYCNILQQDGTERRVKATTTNQGTNVGRVKFGRYCDIITSCYLNDTNYVTCYSAKQNHGLRMLRGGNGSYQPSSAGLIALGNSLFQNSYPASFPCGRLCFFGDIENEDTFND